MYTNLLQILENQTITQIIKLSNEWKKNQGLKTLYNVQFHHFLKMTPNILHELVFFAPLFYTFITTNDY